MKQKHFILGCERSGTTWLSNILDSHPAVEFFMEPFAEYAKILPDFPHRNVYIPKSNENLYQYINEGFKNLYKLKYPLFYRRDKKLFFKAIDRYLIGTLKSLYSIFHSYPPLRVSQYRALNLNSSKIPFKFQSRKNARCNVEFIKELRLNFKIPILSEIFPDSVFLVTIRHPGAQLTSILNLFKKGNLYELQGAIKSFFQYVQNNARFEKYNELIADPLLKKDPETYIILWWLINYEVLIEDLKYHKSKYKLIYCEELSEDPFGITDEVFKFCKLPFDENVSKYIKFSSSSNKSHFAPIETNRDSKIYHKRKIGEVEKSLQNKIKKIFSVYKPMPEVLKAFENFSK